MNGVIIPFSSLRPTPWHNGGGETIEIASGAGGWDRGWEWRISLATISDPGPFSTFGGLQRILTVVDGGELDLRIGTKVHRAHVNEPLGFDGSVPVAASLHGTGTGPIRALNVIFKASAIRAHVEVGRLDRGTSLEAGHLAIMLDGEFSVGGRRLSRFDTVLGCTPPAVVDGQGLLARITLGPRA
ncbi:MAG TPA: HutD family protein [Sinomonas sp.]|nr:HutD family protein [Sinomonas sp.]